jgi:hypothetical protein
MAIKVYQSQIRPTEEIGAVETTPGMRVSMETAAALGAASSKFTGAVTDFIIEKEKVKADTEVLEKKEKIYNGDENIPGLSKVKEDASKMEDPDQADKYYKEEFKKIQDYHSQTTKSFLAKRSLDAFLQKQAVEDSILIRNSSTNNLLERNRLAVEANTDRLKKSIVYGKTDLEISNAQNELNTILESDVYNRVYGKKAAEEKNKVRENVDYYKGLRTLDRDPMKINDVIANSNLPIEKIEKLRSHAKLSSIKIDETSGNNLKDYEAQLDKGNDPGINKLSALKENALATDNFEAVRKIDALLEKREVIVNLKQKSLSDIDQEINKYETEITTLKTENKDVPISLLRKRDIAAKFSADLKTDLEKDLLRAASERNIVTLNNINFNDVLLNPSEENNKLLQDSLAARKNAATTAARYYDKPIPKYFTEAETRQIKEIFDKTTDSKSILNLTKNIVDGFGNDAVNAFEEISKESSFFAHVGGMTVFNNGVPSKGAKDALDGYFLKKNKNIKLSEFKDAEVLPARNSFRNAFLASDKLFDRAIQVADNIYFKRMYDDNNLDGSFEDDIYEEAMNEAVGAIKVNGKQYGGFDKYNGLQVISPNFIGEGNFEDVIDFLEKKPELFKKAGSYIDSSGNNIEDFPVDGKGKKINIFKEKGFFGDPYFITVGPGRYNVSLSNPVGRNAQPEYLLNSKNELFVLDLNKIKSDLGKFAK